MWNAVSPSLFWPTNVGLYDSSRLISRGTPKLQISGLLIAFFCLSWGWTQNLCWVIQGQEEWAITLGSGSQKWTIGHDLEKWLEWKWQRSVTVATIHWLGIWEISTLILSATLQGKQYHTHFIGKWDIWSRSHNQWVPEAQLEGSFLCSQDMCLSMCW